MGSGVEGGAVFLAVKSGWLVRTCAIRCRAQYHGQFLRCEFDPNGTSLVNDTSAVACPRESGYAWALNCRYGCITGNFLNLTICQLCFCGLGIYEVTNEGIHRFTTIANNTAEIPFCFAQQLSQNSVIGEFINLILNTGTGKDYNGLIYTNNCKTILNDCIIAQNKYNQIQHSVNSDIITFQDCVFCKNTFTPDSSVCEDCMPIRFRQFKCTFRTGKFTISDKKGIIFFLLVTFILLDY